MKKIKQIREQYDLITEKEEAETRKLTSLVRAGLFDPKKLPMLKRALNKDPKDMTPAERKILIELLDSLMGEVLQSQQVYSKVKQNVMMKEEKDFEYEMARSELKALIADAQKILSNLKGEGNLEAWVQSKITKAADYINAAADNLEHSDEPVNEAKAFDGYYSKYDPRYTKMPSEREIPTIIILKRKAIRIYPDNQKVALYYSQALDRYVTIPFGTFEGGSVNEEVKSDDDSDNPYVVKSTYTKYKNPKDQKEILRMQGELQKMKNKMASGGYKDAKSKKTADDVIKARSAALTKTIEKAPKSTETKKTDLSKKNPSQLSKSNFGRLMQGISKDDSMNLATKIGAKVGLKTRRAFDKGREGAKKVDTAFEETDTKSKFYAKRKEQIDEAAPLLAPLAVAGARMAAPHIARFIGSQAAKKAAQSAARTPVGKGPKPAPKPAETPTTPKPDVKPQPKTEPKPAETPTPAKPEPKPQSQPKQETKPAETPSATPKPTPKGGKGGGFGRLSRGAGKAAAGAAALAGAALLGVNAPRKPTEQTPFTLRARTSKPVGTVRTAIDARDTSLLRKSMQRNESVLNMLYNINENEEKAIEIASESVVINNTVAKKIIGLYESVNKSNKEKIETMLNESVDSFKKIASFAARQ